MKTIKDIANAITPIIESRPSASSSLTSIPINFMIKTKKIQQK